METSVAQELVQLFAELGLGVTTIKPVQGRASKLTRNNVERLFRENATKPQSTFSFVREATPKYSISLTLSTEDIKGKRTSIQSYLPWSPFAEDASITTKLASDIGSRLSPLDILFARIHSFAGSRGRTRRDDPRRLGASQIQEAYCGSTGTAALSSRGLVVNAFGPFHVIRSSSCRMVRSSGRRARRRGAASIEARAAQARAITHLTGASYDETFARLRARKQALRPVDPTWDADLDPVYRAILTSIGAARSARICEALECLRAAARRGLATRRRGHIRCRRARPRDRGLRHGGGAPDRATPTKSTASAGSRRTRCR